MYYTLKVLAQLSFSESVSQDLSRNTKLSKRLKKLHKKVIIETGNACENEFNKCMKYLIEDIRWNLNEKKVAEDQTIHESEHLFISYENSSKETCVKLKENLENLGYKVWMNTNDSFDSSIDSSIKAIENAACFLMCVTEKYRQSISCQIQAQYAFKLNKRVIPLIMQSGYENVKGWLGIVMNNTIFIDFTKQALDECVHHLKNNINAFLLTREDTELEVLSVSSNRLVLNTLFLRDETSTTAFSTYSLIEDWSEKEVKDWFVRNKINLLIFEFLRPNTGEILHQLFEMKSNSTEFYYQSLNEIKDIQFHDIILFSSCLSKLFKDKS